ncbi:MAG: hypothetical protein MZV63_41285 [Marinilabiliales bacterium]|nr:hypothetical protein [Marinilabiliales bacterium]
MKAGRIPVIAAAIGGALWLLGFLGGLMGILFWVVAAFAGYWYVNLVLKSGAKPVAPRSRHQRRHPGRGRRPGLCRRDVDRHQHPLPRTGRRPGGIRLPLGLRLHRPHRPGGRHRRRDRRGGWYAFKTGMIKTK